MVQPCAGMCKNFLSFLRLNTFHCNTDSCFLSTTTDGLLPALFPALGYMKSHCKSRCANRNQYTLFPVGLYKLPEKELLDRRVILGLCPQKFWQTGQWWCKPLIPGLRGKGKWISELEAWATQTNPALKKKKQIKVPTTSSLSGWVSRTCLSLATCPRAQN